MFKQLPRIARYALITVLSITITAAVAGTALAYTNSNRVQEISIEQAESIALDKVGGGTVSERSTSTDDGRKEYEFTIILDNIKYTLDVYADNGEINDFEQDTITVETHVPAEEETTAPVTESSTPAESTAPAVENTTATGESAATPAPAQTSDAELTLEQAKQIALTAVGGGTVTSYEVDYYRVKHYDFEISLNGYEHDIEISAVDGSVISHKSKWDDDSAYALTRNVSEAEAKQIALAKVGGGTITSFSYDSDDNEYEIEVRFSHQEYDLTISGRTGDILEYEID